MKSSPTTFPVRYQEGSGVLGWTYKCKGWETDPNAYAYIILQRGAKDFEKACQGLGFEDWLTNPDFNTADARDRHKQEIYKRIGDWAIQRDKYEVVKELAPYGVPCAPVINTKELMEDQSLYDGNTLVKINQGARWRIRNCRLPLHHEQLYSYLRTVSYLGRQYR